MCLIGQVMTLKRNSRGTRSKLPRNLQEGHDGPRLLRRELEMRACLGIETIRSFLDVRIKLVRVNANHVLQQVLVEDDARIGLKHSRIIQRSGMRARELRVLFDTDPPPTSQ